MCIKVIYINGSLCLFWLTDKNTSCFLRDSLWCLHEFPSAAHEDILKNVDAKHYTPLTIWMEPNPLRHSRSFFICVPSCQVLSNLNCTSKTMARLIDKCFLCSLVKEFIQCIDALRSVQQHVIRQGVTGRKSWFPLKKPRPGHWLLPVYVSNLRGSRDQGRGEYVNCILSCSPVPAFLPSRIRVKEEKIINNNRRKLEYGAGPSVFQ